MELCGESVRETERFAVTAAAGALGPVLKKLSALLGDEYKLLKGTRRDIESIKSELEPVHDLLGKLWGREDLDVACKDWMTEARELSYYMEDGIDSFTDGLERGNGRFFQQGDTVSPFKEFMERVKYVTNRCGQMQKIGDNICNRSNLSTDPRAHFLHKDASELVGMEEKKEKLIKLLEEHEMVCILGSAGVGKTTLADLVYHTIGDQFQCRAFVSLHPRPNMTEILGTILSQVTDGAMSAGSGTLPAAEQNIVNKLYEKSEPTAEQNDFIEGISSFLSDKSYLVIIDDIWQREEWEVIRKALPKNNRRCRLITTTRVANIALTEQGAGLLHLQGFGGTSDVSAVMRLSRFVEGTNANKLHTKIVDMCTGGDFSPLAVICLLSAWAQSHRVQSGDEDLDTWARQVLGDGFLSTPSLKPLVQSIRLGFDDLPAQLRTCLLYFTLYPPEHWIEREWLVKKWVGEGFASQAEVAEAYLEELVSRNLLQYTRDSHGIYFIKVGTIMRAFLVCKAKEDNFIAYDGPVNTSQAKQIHYLSVTRDHYPDKDVLPHARSLVVCGRERQMDGVPFKAFKKLRALEILSSRHLQNGHLVDICGLIWLRYLGLYGCCRIRELPREIGRLQNLEALYARGTNIEKLPADIGKLQHLRTLDVSWTMVRKLPKEIRKLQHLRTLDICGTGVREIYCRKDPNSLLSVVLARDSFGHEKVKLHLGAISSSFDEEVVSSSEVKFREDLSILLLFNYKLHKKSEGPVKPVALLSVEGMHIKIPQWVKDDLRNVCSLDIRLCKLVDEDLEFLKTEMPNLQDLQLRLEVLPRQPVAITGGGFPKLERFYIDCRLPSVITFEEGAMPMLKYLEFKFYSGPARSQDYSMGIKHLPSLEVAVFRCFEYYTSQTPDIPGTIEEAVRKEAAEHPNKIDLYYNSIWRQHEKEIKEMNERISQQRLELSMAAERRAEREKSNAVIQKKIQERKRAILQQRREPQRKFGCQ